MELEELILDNCICGHGEEIHCNTQMWPGRYICLVDGCDCKSFRWIMDYIG
jgi:hypothetical protein